MANPTLKITPHLAALAVGVNQALDVLVTIEVPENKSKAKKARPSLNLAVVIDISGSMAGRPLEEAKSATNHLVRSLQDGDRVAVVVYADHARVLMASTPAAQAKLQIGALLAAVGTEGMTALQAGWLTGAQQLAPFVSEYGISRVLLLSDGCANIGASDPEQLGAEAEKLAASGISSSTYGIGENFNELLMAKLAQGGQGHAFYASNADALVSYFSSEFQMLCDMVGRDVRLSLIARDAKGNTIEVKCLNELPEADDGQWRLPALLEGSETWAVFSLQETTLKTGQAVSVEASAKWTGSDGKSHSAQTTIHIKSAKANGKENEAAVERAKEARAAVMARQAAETARRGDLAGSQHIIRTMSAMAGNNAYINGVSNHLSAVAASGNTAMLAKEAFYGSTTMSSRVADIGEDAKLLSGGRYGLKKAAQGKAAEAKGETP